MCKYKSQIGHFKKAPKLSIEQKLKFFKWCTTGHATKNYIKENFTALEKKNCELDLSQHLSLLTNRAVNQ